MLKNMKVKLVNYTGSFILVHMITYLIAGIIFLGLKSTLPVTSRVALDFYRPFRLQDFSSLILQAIRGGVLALILLPFYDTWSGKRGGMLLAGALWGLALFGSVEPMPGSLEGIIYTKTMFIEHVLVLGAGAIQVLLFVKLFLWCQSRFNFQKMSQEEA